MGIFRRTNLKGKKKKWSASRYIKCIFPASLKRRKKTIAAENRMSKYVVETCNNTTIETFFVWLYYYTVVRYI